MLDLINLQSHKGKRSATQIVYCFHTIAATTTAITQMKIFSPNHITDFVFTIIFSRADIRFQGKVITTRSYKVIF